jgi:hypothetical protein
MNETRQQLKFRLQAAGVWKDFLALREKLVNDGLTSARAREEALREIESRLPRKADVAVADGPRVDTPTRKYPKWSPLCHLCQPHGEPRCGNCVENWHECYVADCERLGKGSFCPSCWIDAGMPSAESTPQGTVH